MKSPKTQARKPPQQARSRATVDAILRATARILVKEGYDRASTNKIARAAGVSIGSLYQYFPSKEALVAELLERHCAERLALLSASSLRYASAPLPEAVRGAVEAQIRTHRVDSKLHKVLIEQVPRMGRLDRITELNRQSAELVKAYLDAHRSQVRVRDTALASVFVVKIMEALTHLLVFDRPEQLDDPTIIDEIADIVVRYVGKGTMRGASLGFQRRRPSVAGQRRSRPHAACGEPGASVQSG